MKAMKTAFVLAVVVLVSASSVCLLAWGPSPSPTPTPRALSAARFAASLAPTTPAQTTSQQVYQPGNGVTFPTLLRHEQPVYTEAARRARAEGVVVLEVVVRTDGTVGDVRYSRSLDSIHGLDENAVAAAKRWLFKPGLREGKPVATIVTLELEFRLSDWLSPPRSAPRQTAPTATPTTTSPRAPTAWVLSGSCPILRTQVHPRYTADAMRAKFQAW